MSMASSSMDGKQNNNHFDVKDIVNMAIFASILFVQEEIFTFIPNVQLTIFLIILYSKKLGFIRTSIIISIHVLLDSLVMGFNIIFFITMIIGWMFIPLMIHLFCRRIENPFILGIFGAIGAFLYSWTFIIPNSFIFNMDPLVYLAADILFELILAACGFLTTLFLYKPCSNLFDRLRITKTKIVIDNENENR